MWPPKLLRGDVTSVTGKPTIPGRGKTAKGHNSFYKLTKSEKAYLRLVAESMALGEKPPTPPNHLKELILYEGGIERWIQKINTRKTFYVSALFAARRRLK